MHGQFVQLYSIARRVADTWRDTEREHCRTSSLLLILVENAGQLDMARGLDIGEANVVT